MAEQKPAQRLLPSDYTKLLKTEKDVRMPENSGIFTFPEDIVGEQNIGDRKFLVFYFDDEDDYEFVKGLLEKPNAQTRSHPSLSSRKLVRLLRKGRRADGKS